MSVVKYIDKNLIWGTDDGYLSFYFMPQDLIKTSARLVETFKISNSKILDFHLHG